MSIKHVALAAGSLTVDVCDLCGGRTLMMAAVVALTEDGVQTFGFVDRCLTCEPFESGD